MAEISASFDPKEALSLLVRRKWLVIIPVVLVTAIAIAGSYFIPPEFESSAIVWMGNPVMLSNDVERMLGQFQQVVGGKGRQDVRDYVRQIASPAYAAQIFDLMELDEDPLLDQKARSVVALQSDISLRDAKIILTGSRLTDNLELEFVSQSHLRLKAKAAAAVEARDLAQAVAEVFVEEKAREQLRTIFLSLDFSYKQLAVYEKQLKDKIDEKTRLEQEISKWQSDNSLNSEANRADLASEIQRRNQDIQDLKSTEASLISSLDRLGRSPIRVEASTMLTSLKRNINQLISSVDELILEYAWKDPAINSLSLRIVSLEDEVEKEHEVLVDQQYADLDVTDRNDIIRLTNLRHRIALLERVVTALQSGMQALQAARASVPEYQSRLNQLTREVQMAERIRDRFRTQQESFEISQALVEESQYRVVEDARISASPVWPDRQLIVLIGFLTGLFVGGTAIFLVELSDRTLKTAAAVEEFLGLQVVGVVPRIEETR